MNEIRNSRIERHIRRMGGPAETCGSCQEPADHLIDGDPMCDQCAKEDGIL